MRLSAALILLAGALAGASAAAAAAGAAPCLAEVAVAPHAFVGEQVLYRVRILRRLDVARVEWEQPPAFPDLRVEWLPGRAEDTREKRDGVTYLAREERRALFPPRPGRLVLPSFTLRCQVDASVLVRVSVPSANVDVSAPPSAGRPAGWSGVVGRIQVQVTADRLELPLGESVRLSVLVRGASNLWDLPHPFEEGFVAAEVFTRPDEVAHETGDRLYVRRFFRLDVVPHEIGTLGVPGLEIPFFDPDAGRYEVARSEPIEIHVQPPREGDSRSLSSAVPAPDDDSPAAASREGAGLHWTALAGTVGLGIVALGALRARQRRNAPWKAVDAALEAARDGARSGESAAELEALSRALGCAIAARADVDREPGELLREIEELRFAPRNAEPDPARIARLRERVEGVIRALRAL